MNIVVDTREQKPLWQKNIITKGLKTGDYSIEGFEDKIAIERKSVADLFGSLSRGHARFKKELERAQSLDFFAIVVEGSIDDIYNKNFDYSYKSKMKGFVISKIMCTLMVKYKILFIFSGDRTNSRRIIKELFNSYIKTQNGTK